MLTTDSAPDDVWIDSDPDDPVTTAATHRALVVELGRRLRAAAADQRPGDSAVDVVSLRHVRLTSGDRARAERIADDAISRIRALDSGDGGTEPVTLGLFLFRTPSVDGSAGPG